MTGIELSFIFLVASVVATSTGLTIGWVMTRFRALNRRIQMLEDDQARKDQKLLEADSRIEVQSAKISALQARSARPDPRVVRPEERDRLIAKNDRRPKRPRKDADFADLGRSMDTQFTTDPERMAPFPETMSSTSPEGSPIPVPALVQKTE